MFCQKISQFYITYVLTSSTYVLTVLGLGWWWVDDEKERKTKRQRIEMKRDEREIFFILFYSIIYIILIYCM